MNHASRLDPELTGERLTIQTPQETFRRLQKMQTTTYQTFSVRALLAVLLLIAIPAVLVAQDKQQKIDELISAYNQFGQFNGSALVAENGKVLLKKGYGLANMEWNIPNQPDTKFRL